MPLLHVTEATHALALETQAKLAERSRHRGVTPTDLVVAATAEAYRVTLLHYFRHFDAIARVTGQPTRWLARRGSLS
jgi:predicted nucleic acid-binding protein